MPAIATSSSAAASTGDAACKGIREHDPDGTIGLVGAEPHPPYARPPLSKGLWKGDAEDSIWRGTDAIDGVELLLGRHRRDPRPRRARRCATTTARSIGYEKLLLATGGSPRTLPRRRRASSTSARSTTSGGCARSPSEGAASS